MCTSHSSMTTRRSLIQPLRRVSETFTRRTYKVELQSVHEFFAHFG